MNKIALIIGREYLSRVKKKSFILLTFLGPLLLAAVMAFVIWIGLSENSNQTILVIDDTKGAFSNMDAGENFKFMYIDDLEIDAAKEGFNDSQYTSILHIPQGILDNKRPLLYFKEQPSTMMQRSIESRVEKVVENEKLKLYGIDKNDYKRVKTNFDLALIKFTESGKEEEVMTEKARVGFVFGIAIYMFIFLYGVQVMRGVIEEKSNRIVEVIISSVKPFQLMMGKIIGIALVSLTQFLLWIVLSITFISVSQSLLFKDKLQEVSTMQMQTTTELADSKAFQEADVDITDLTNPQHLINRINWGLMIGLFMFYFLGGYLLYSSLFAAIGAAVDSETDTQQFMLPITLPLLLAYFLSFTIIENPESPAAFWGSIIPFTSPVIMMVRVAIGLEPGEYWQLFLSMGLLIAGFIFTTWLAGKIYRTGILMYGKKVNYKEIWKWIRYHD